MSLDKTAAYQDRLVACSGTCFLTTIAHRHVFVTASHVLSDPSDGIDLYLSFNTQDDKPGYVKVTALYTKHLRRDLSFFVPTDQMVSQYRHLFVPLPPLMQQLPVGAQVSTYGFPGSRQVGEASGVPVVHIQRQRYDGSIVAIESDFWIANTARTVYHLDFPSPRGLSGAPIICVGGEGIYVAGYILVEMDSNGRKFAVATDYTPFVEIERLLLDVFPR